MTPEHQLRQEIQSIVDGHGENVDYHGWEIDEPKRSEATLKLLALIDRERRNAVREAFSHFVAESSKPDTKKRYEQVFNLIFPNP